MDPRKLFLDLCFVRSNDKNCPKPFLHWKDCLSFQKILFSTTLRSWKNDLLTSIVNVRLVLDHRKPSPEVCQDRIYEKKQVKIFSLLENCPFFWKKMCFQQPLRSWRNDLSFSTVIVKLASGLIETVTWGLSNSNIREKNWPKTFPHWITCLFFKKSCFQQPLRSWRNDLITSIVIVRLVSGPSKTVPWGLSHSIIGGRIGHKLFFTGKFAFFPKKIVFPTTS